MENSLRLAFFVAVRRNSNPRSKCDPVVKSDHIVYVYLSLAEVTGVPFESDFKF